LAPWLLKEKAARQRPTECRTSGTAASIFKIIYKDKKDDGTEGIEDLIK